MKRLQDFADLAILGVAALLLPVNAWAISDGEWFATLQCGARTDVQPVRPPYSGVLPKWVIKDGRTDLEIRQPGPQGAFERWEGQIRDGVIEVSARGMRGPGDRWAYRFSGTNGNAQAVILEGAIHDIAGKKLRACSFTIQENAVLPHINGLGFLSDRALMREGADFHAYPVKPAPVVAPLRLDADVKALPGKPREGLSRLMASPYAKAIVLIDDEDVYFSGKALVDAQSLFYTASIAKTVTSVAVGQAMCRGHLRLDDEISRYLPELKGRTLGTARIRDLLMMASGVKDPMNAAVGGSGNVLQPADHEAYWSDPAFRFTPVLFRNELASSQKVLFSDVRPGQRFSYNNLNPMWLGLIINRSTGARYAQWLQETVFDPAGFEGGGFVAQDRDGVGSADGVFGLRLKVSDWIRFARWFRAALDGNDCLGGYLREASARQIDNGLGQPRRRTEPDFAGYGYLVWSGHPQSERAFWALGFGGQMIGWNRDNRKIILTMSNLEDWTGSAVRLYDDWISGRQ